MFDLKFVLGENSQKSVSVDCVSRKKDGVVFETLIGRKNFFWEVYGLDVCLCGQVSPVASHHS